MTLAVEAVEAVEAQTARGLIRQRFRESFRDQPDAVLPDVAKEIMSWLEGQPDLVWEYQRDRLYAALYADGQAVLAETRTPGNAKFDEKLEDVKTKFESWMEHSNDRHIRLMDMTKPDLLAAAAEREKRGHAELKIARVWRAIAAQLSDGERVRDRFSAKELKMLHRGGELEKEAAA